MSKPNQLNLGPIRQRLKVRTPGNWKKALGKVVGRGGVIALELTDEDDETVIIECQDWRDAEFVAHAPDDIQKLCDEVARLRQELLQKRLFE